MIKADRVTAIMIVNISCTIQIHALGRVEQVQNREHRIDKRVSLVWTELWRTEKLLRKYCFIWFIKGNFSPLSFAASFVCVQHFRWEPIMFPNSLLVFFFCITRHQRVLKCQYKIVWILPEQSIHFRCLRHLSLQRNTNPIFFLLFVKWFSPYNYHIKLHTSIAARRVYSVKWNRLFTLVFILIGVRSIKIKISNIEMGSGHFRRKCELLSNLMCFNICWMNLRHFENYSLSPRQRNN